MRAPHRCCCKAFQDPPRACDYHRESQAPQTASHQVHADQTGNKEIDVTSAGFGDLLFTNFDDIRASFTALQGIVDDEPCGATLGARWVETIIDRFVLRP